MDKELNTLNNNNNTWTPVELLKGKKAIWSKFKTKYLAGGTIEIQKALLIAKAFNQAKGYDHNETRAPITKFILVKYLISIAATKNWELHQMDVINAFFS